MAIEFVDDQKQGDTYNKFKSLFIKTDILTGEK